jgi:hypothetical protein
MKRIPIAAARRIAKDYGATQVVIWAFGPGGQHVTTYGVSLEDCNLAAIAGNHVKKAAGWPLKKCDAVPSRVKREATRLVMGAIDNARASYDGDPYGLNAIDYVEALIRNGDVK